jgi:hypothetical protein
VAIAIKHAAEARDDKSTPYTQQQIEYIEMLIFKSTKKSIVTPKVEAFRIDSRPNTKFHSEGIWSAEGKVSIKAAPPLIETINKMLADCPDTKKSRNSRSPIQEHDDTSLLFRCKSKNRPKIYDSMGKEIKEDIEIGNGSIVKYAVTLVTYSDGANSSVTAYLNGIQILKLAEFTTSPFQKEEGCFIYNANNSNRFAEANDDEDKDGGF